MESLTCLELDWDFIDKFQTGCTIKRGDVGAFHILCFESGRGWAGRGWVGGEFCWLGLKAIGRIRDCSEVSFDAFVFDVIECTVLPVRLLFLYTPKFKCVFYILNPI